MIVSELLRDFQNVRDRIDADAQIIGRVFDALEAYDELLEVHEKIEETLRDMRSQIEYIEGVL